MTGDKNGVCGRVRFLAYRSWTSQSITALTARRKEEWRKEAADIPPSKVDNDLCSTGQILALFFEGNLGETAERRGGARMGLSERYDAVLS